MKHETYLGEMGEVKANNRLLKFCIVFLTVATIFNSALTFWALRDQKVILIPPGLDARTNVSAHTLDEAYVSCFSKYVAALAFNYTPLTAQKNFDELLTLYDPAHFAQGSKMFRVLAESVILQTKASSTFFVAKVEVDTGKKRIELKGVRRQFMGDNRVEDRERTYFIEYTVHNGKFVIVAISQGED